MPNVSGFHVSCPLAVVGKPTIVHMSGRRTNRGAALGVAAGGVLLGHWLTYQVVAPHALARQALLARTGHAYLGLANDIGLAVALAGLAAVFLSRLTRRDSAPASTIRWCARLAAFQVGAFASMELVERLGGGAPLRGVLHDGLLPLGLMIQVGVALAGAVAVRWLLHVAEIAAEGGRPASLWPDIEALVLGSSSVPAPIVVGHPATGIRGPPSVV
jgi:hypothetical protein